MQKKDIILEILKTQLFQYNRHSNSSIRIHSFLKSASLSFSRKLRSKINIMVYFFLVYLKNRLSLLAKSITNRLKYRAEIPPTQLSKSFLLYTIPELSYDIVIRQVLHSFLKVRKSVLDFYKRCIYLYFIFWNLLLSVVGEHCNNIVLPKTRSLKTILRSPHIDKRSREQFEKIEHHSLMLLPSYLGNITTLINYVVPTFGVQITQHLLLKR